MSKDKLSIEESIENHITQALFSEQPKWSENSFDVSKLKEMEANAKKHYPITHTIQVNRYLMSEIKTKVPQVKFQNTFPDFNGVNLEVNEKVPWWTNYIIIKQNWEGSLFSEYPTRPTRIDLQKKLDSFNRIMNIKRESWWGDSKKGINDET